jgi:hypothetical protein
MHSTVSTVLTAVTGSDWLTLAQKPKSTNFQVSRAWPSQRWPSFLSAPTWTDDDGSSTTAYSNSTTRLVVPSPRLPRATGATRLAFFSPPPPLPQVSTRLSLGTPA